MVFLGTSGGTNSLMNSPSGIARDPRTGTIYVADTLAHNVVC